MSSRPGSGLRPKSGQQAAASLVQSQCASAVMPEAVTAALAGGDELYGSDQVLYDELRGVLEGVLAPASAGPRARQAAASLADACADWLHQQHSLDEAVAGDSKQTACRPQQQQQQHVAGVTDCSEASSAVGDEGSIGANGELGLVAINGIASATLGPTAQQHHVRRQGRPRASKKAGPVAAASASAAGSSTAINCRQAATERAAQPGTRTSHQAQDGIVSAASGQLVQVKANTAAVGSCLSVQGPRVARDAAPAVPGLPLACLQDAHTSAGNTKVRSVPSAAGSVVYASRTAAGVPGVADTSGVQAASRQSAGSRSSCSATEAAAAAAVGIMQPGELGQSDEPAGLTVLSYCVGRQAGSSGASSDAEGFQGYWQQDSAPSACSMQQRGSAASWQQQQPQQHGWGWQPVHCVPGPCKMQTGGCDAGGEEGCVCLPELRQLQQQSSNCSSTSSLPSIPSCADMLQAVQSQQKRKGKQDCQLPMLVAASSIPGQQQQQAPYEAQTTQLPKLQEQPTSSGDAAMAAAADAALQAVWKASAGVVAAQLTANTTAVKQALQGTEAPPLQNLLQAADRVSEGERWLQLLGVHTSKNAASSTLSALNSTDHLYWANSSMFYVAYLQWVDHILAYRAPYAQHRYVPDFC